jgi:hypothetical protein
LLPPSAASYAELLVPVLVLVLVLVLLRRRPASQEPKSTGRHVDRARHEKCEPLLASMAA